MAGRAKGLESISLTIQPGDEVIPPSQPLKADNGNNVISPQIVLLLNVRATSAAAQLPFLPRRRVEIMLNKRGLNTCVFRRPTGTAKRGFHKRPEIHGGPGLEKTNVIGCCIIAETKNGGTSLYLEPEDTAKGFVSKLRSLSCDDPEIIQTMRDGRIKYVHNPDPDVIKDAIVWAVEHKPTLVVLAGLAELMAQVALNEDIAGDLLKFLRTRVRPFAEKAGSAVLISDHTATVSSGMYARGSGAKKGSYDGVSYEL